MRLLTMGSVTAIAIALSVGVPTKAEAYCCRIKKPRITVGKPRVTVAAPRVTVGSPQVTVGTPKVTIGRPRVTVGQPTVVVGKPMETAEEIVRRTGKGLGRPVGEVLKTANTVATNVVTASVDAGTDAAATAGKAHKDLVAEAGRAVENVEELGTALRRYAVSTATGTARNITDAEKRLREGKFADAFWHAAVDPLKGLEERAATLAQESSLANTVGSVAAAAYGGPGGSAAYASWYAYRASGGNVELALKAGVIAGATSAALSTVNGMPVDAANPAPDMAKKAIVAGAIGGIAVAAAGGDGDALRDGFLKSGGMMLIRDGYKQYTGGHDLVENTKAPTEGGFCALAIPSPEVTCAPPKNWFKLGENGEILTNAKGEPILDISKVDPRHSYVGLASAGEGHWFKSENGAFMEGFVAKIPGANAMAIFHDQWVITAPLTGWSVQATIFPAIVVTYLGTEAGIQSHIQEAIQRQKNGQPAPGGLEAKVTAAQAVSYLCAGEVLVGEERRIRAVGGVTVREEIRPITKVDQRSVFTVIGSKAGEFACAVVYQKHGQDYVPFYAENDAHFCGPKAEEIVVNHVNAGWSCYARTPVQAGSAPATATAVTASRLLQ